MDRYKSFTDLKKNECKGKDYVIHYRNTYSDTVIMAPHGGGIEPGTLDLADEIAGMELSFYSFSGIKTKGNRVLHIKSIMFDEPIALDMAGNAHTVLTIHGSRDRDEIVYTGGKNSDLIHAVSNELTESGFYTQSSKKSELKGKNNINICNRCRSGMGVQLEVSLGLRQKMFDYSRSFSTGEKSARFYDFVRAVRNVLLSGRE